MTANRESTGVQDAQKRAAALRALELIEEGMVVGLGTGSTVRHLLAGMAEHRRRGALRRIVAVPTSTETETRARALGIPLSTLDEHGRVDLTIDGADEVDDRLRLIKGLGGALLREKIVAALSDRFVVVVDESKLVERLGSRAPLPVEVDPFGAGAQIPFLRNLGAEPRLRTTPDGGPLRTDGGHLILDCHFSAAIHHPEELDRRLQARPGILETGLFLGMADAVVVAGEHGVRMIARSEAAGAAR